MGEDGNEPGPFSWVLGLLGVNWAQDWPRFGTIGQTGKKQGVNWFRVRRGSGSGQRPRLRPGSGLPFGSPVKIFIHSQFWATGSRAIGSRPEGCHPRRPRKEGPAAAKGARAYTDCHSAVVGGVVSYAGGSWPGILITEVRLGEEAVAARCIRTGSTDINLGADWWEKAVADRCTRTWEDTADPNADVKLLGRGCDPGRCEYTFGVQSDSEGLGKGWSNSMHLNFRSLMVERGSAVKIQLKNRSRT